MRAKQMREDAMPALTRELWSTLEPLLDEALDLDPPARAGMLDRLRTESPLLAEHLEALLAGESAGDDELFADSPLGEALASLDPGAAGRQVGPYTLDRCIGRGGMGTVWLAHRSDGRYEGQVAIKLLNLALVGRAGAERFGQEGRLLARVTHPNIARLLDAGVTAAGQPYLVLEHVIGQPIDQFADEQGCTADERIRLCLDVLAAVAAAHAALIVHRDIKPSNILVSADGTVKLLDFGIAKLLHVGEQSAHVGMLTDHAGRALTPDYAAPEVILGEPVSTATDVYSIGVLLYVLLSGRHPTGHGCRTPAEHIRATLETEPLPVSIAVARGTDARGPAEQRATMRAASPHQLARRYHGDLDNILAKALAKQPAERYASVTAFADDLLRFAHHQPVSAHGGSWAYRTRKFTRRHRTGIVAASLVALSLIGGSGFSYNQMLVAQRERDRAARALKRSAATTAFESLLFRLLEPGGQPLTYRQLLDRGREALERQYRGDPISRMQLGIQFAVNYLREDDSETADAIIRQTVAIADSVGDAHWQGRTRCELAFAYAKRGQGDSAAALVTTARAYLAGVPDVERGTANACDGAQAEALMAQERFARAAVLFGAVADRFAADGDTTTESYITALNDQARAYFSDGHIREARHMVLRMLKLGHAGAASDPQSNLVLAYNANRTYEMLGEFRGRRDFLRREVALVEADTLAPRHPVLLFEYGMTLDLLEQYDSAAAWLGRALDSDLGPTRAYVAHLTLARRAHRSGRLAEAARYEREVMRLQPLIEPVAIARSATAAAHIRTVAARGDAAALRAEVTAQMASLEYSSESDASRLIMPLLAAATALLDAGTPAEADIYAAHAVRIALVDSAAERRSAIVGHGRLLRARAALARGDSARARVMLDHAMPALAFGYGPGHSVHEAARQLRVALRN
ncbi:MAG: protein kinase domain-containing protein [Longimicrobiales bacterium]